MHWHHFRGWTAALRPDCGLRAWCEEGLSSGTFLSHVSPSKITFIPSCLIIHIYLLNFFCKMTNIFWNLTSTSSFSRAKSVMSFGFSTWDVGDEPTTLFVLSWNATKSERFCPLLFLRRMFHFWHHPHTCVPFAVSCEIQGCVFLLNFFIADCLLGVEGCALN